MSETDMHPMQKIAAMLRTAEREMSTATSHIDALFAEFARYIESLQSGLDEALKGWEGWLLDQQYTGMDRQPFERIAELRKLIS